LLELRFLNQYHCLGDRTLATNAPATAGLRSASPQEMTFSILIRSIRRYTGLTRPTIRGQRVVVVAVHRGDVDNGVVFRDDESIGELLAEDRIEFAEIVTETDGRERATWVTADAAAWELGPVEGRWDGLLPRGVVLERRLPGL